MKKKMENKFNKTKCINVLFTEKHSKIIDEIAYKHELNRSEFIRNHIIILINNYNKNKNEKENKK
jgi:metal-responsive CopG/Arc/MetJ family transcriptional regulator